MTAIGIEFGETYVSVAVQLALQCRPILIPNQHGSRKTVCSDCVTLAEHASSNAKQIAPPSSISTITPSATQPHLFTHPYPLSVSNIGTNEDDSILKQLCNGSVDAKTKVTCILSAVRRDVDNYLSTFASSLPSSTSSSASSTSSSSSSSSSTTTSSQLKAVIAVPTLFDDRARMGLRDAALSAGFEVLRTLNEPAAVCLGHNLLALYDQQGMHDEKFVVVIDVGARHSGMAVIAIEDGALEVRDTVTHRTGHSSAPRHSRTATNALTHAPMQLLISHNRS